MTNRNQAFEYEAHRGFQIGDEVIARFTNSGRFLQFTGIIVGETKNYWKVRSLTSPYDSEAPGRVFHIPTCWSRQYSTNNCIQKQRKD